MPSLLLILLLLVPFNAHADRSPQPVAPTPPVTASAKHNGGLDLIISPQFEPEMQQNLQRWANHLAASLRLVYGYWPRSQWRMSFTPISAAARDPIPHARVHRDDIDTIEFYVSPQASVRALSQSFTGYHEIGHLLIPYRGWGDLWFSEGIATYYQHLLMARSGQISEQQMWQNLLDGLIAAELDHTHEGHALSEISDAMPLAGGDARVYGSGARYFLEIDVRLRRQSNGRLTLDSALERLNRCCADQLLSVPQMVSELDTLNGVVLFRSLYHQYRQSSQLPPYRALFSSLGIAVHEGQVTLQDVGPGAALRRQITQIPHL